MKNFTGLLIVCCILYSCNETPVNKFSDSVIVKIADLQDRRQSDSLYVYLKDENAIYRKEATLAFASVQDTLAIDRLEEILLVDSDAEVRKAAAIALGQTPSKETGRILLEALKSEKDSHVLREILESCGKTINKSEINQLDVSSSDSLLQEGLAWAYYRLGLRNQVDSTITIKAAKFLDAGFGLQTRLAAANFFARGAQKVALTEKELLAAAQNDRSPWIRASVTSALRRV